MEWPARLPLVGGGGVSISMYYFDIERKKERNKV